MYLASLLNNYFGFESLMAWQLIFSNEIEKLCLKTLEAFKYKKYILQNKICKIYLNEFFPLCNCNQFDSFLIT